MEIANDAMEISIDQPGDVAAAKGAVEQTRVEPASATRSANRSTAAAISSLDRAETHPEVASTEATPTQEDPQAAVSRALPGRSAS